MKLFEKFYSMNNHLINSIIKGWHINKHFNLQIGIISRHNIKFLESKLQDVTKLHSNCEFV
jgi:hypothetical protein